MLLSEQELRHALEPLLDRILVERFKYFQLQLEARLQSLIAETLVEAKPLPDGSGGGNAIAEVLRAGDADGVFEVIFSAAGELVGPARALLVRYQDVVTLWRQEGMELPPRFPAAEQSAVLKAEAGGESGTHPVRVRGRIVGLLHWRAAAAPGTAPMAQLELILEAAGLRLLALGLEEAEEPRESRAEGRAGGAPEEEPARAFAQLLAEDLELYLRRERAAEVAEARRVEDAWHRFQPEVERCRRGYRERYPAYAELGEMVFREMMERLQGEG